ncbi:S9 family peptidase [Runella slithyformis]|uniref:Peptidase S9 prolyl oligopeptidase n=1 Tax=Runella slithyformis (strain ATCC 29530 / DSM 19594 / LMG 11500 / NCIMB 11436 / LSU 4) TaxID=761193 RepID=A0A7U4E3S7_RUNSL|nr:prolyl oligopeptidase family serine peptidase [Runella slithyformis]AEI46698.1 peptidase S9 prolyl oligopeptidase [Runella slithyformis DSM 19594]
MKKLFVLLGFILSTAALAQPKPKPTMAWKDVLTWKSIPGFGGTQLSPDGQWYAYVLSTYESDAELIIQKTTDSTKYVYPIGAPSFVQMSFSDNSKWIAFKVFAKDKDKKAAAKPGGKPVPDKVFLVELASNKKTEFDRVKSFAFNGEKVSHLAVLLTAAGAGPSGPPSGGASDAAKGSDLLLFDLATSKTQNVGNVSEMAFDKSGNWLALTIDANEKAGNGVQLRNMTTGIMLTMDNDKARYQSLNWTEKGDGLALLKSTKDEKYKNERVGVLGIKNFGTMPELTAYEPKTDSVNFPKDMTVSPNRAPYWSEDLTRLFFGIHKLELAKKDDKKPAEAKKDSTKKLSDVEKLAKIKADTTLKTIEDLQKALAKIKADTTKSAVAAKPDDTEKPEVTVWHWQDKRLQSRQQVQEPQDKNRSFLSMYDVAAKKFVQLADSMLKNVSVAPKQLYALGTEDSKYELETSLDGQNYQDVYLVDLKTGKREKIREKHYLPNFWAGPQPSPDGTKFLYWEGTQYFVYDMVNKTSRNITQEIKTSFVDKDDDRNQKTPPVGMIGWSSDSKSVLLSDGWDIWQVPTDPKDAKGKALTALNLTQNGKRDKIRYEQRYQLDPEEKGIDLKKPIYVRMYGEWTKKSGLARIENGKTLVVKPLIWEDAAIGSLTKAKKADVFVFAKETFTKPRQYFVSNNAELTSEKQLTKNAPMFDKYAWSAGTRLVDYVSDKGDTLQGALFLPAGYEQGKKYPTIIYYYEKLSQTLHNFSNPGYSGTGWNPAIYTSNGYAVFIPDIVYKFNDPGMSAVWCILPGVKAALKTGVIDEARMGIHGHSWGGYQTSFLITQTNMFKAAAAGAPLTDMISMYNLIYKNSGTSNGQIFEGSQGRLVAPWENWDAYHRNSPIYHVTKVQTPLLLLHNDADGAVDFTQGVEFYTALRRLKKPVVMMQYKGENHGLAKQPNRKDYSVRMMEFFDAHLKGKPAPEWWSKGIPRLDLDKHLENRIFEN